MVGFHAGLGDTWVGCPLEDGSVITKVIAQDGRTGVSDEEGGVFWPKEGQTFDSLVKELTGHSPARVQ